MDEREDPGVVRHSERSQGADLPGDGSEDYVSEKAGCEERAQVESVDAHSGALCQ